MRMISVRSLESIYAYMQIQVIFLHFFISRNFWGVKYENLHSWLCNKCNGKCKCKIFRLGYSVIWQCVEAWDSWEMASQQSQQYSWIFLSNDDTYHWSQNWSKKLPLMGPRARKPFWAKIHMNSKEIQLLQ